MGFEKYYDKDLINKSNMSLDEFVKKVGEGNGSFLSEIHSKFIFRTKDEILKPYQVELIKLQEHLEKHNEKMMILMEGRDASGKGGAIRRITRYMNEKHYRVVALGKPSDVQKTQWYFQRYVEHLIDHGFHFLKIYLSVSKEEQARRFEEREENPLKQWKLSEIDMQMQSRWEEFTQKKYDMLKYTNTPKSPWTIIRSDSKFLARLNSIKVILNSIPYEGRDERLDFSVDSDIVITAEKELEIMDYKKNSGITQGLI